MNTKIKISFLLLTVSTMCLGQTGIEADNLEVIKTFEAQLEEAQIIDVRPKLPKVILVKKVYDFRISIVPLELKYPAPIIKPLAMMESNTFDADNHFIRLGYGTLNDPNGRVRLSFYDGDRYKLNILGGYRALDNTSKVAYQKMSDIDAGITGFARLNENVALNFKSDINVAKRNYFDTKTNYPTLNYGEEQNITGINLKAGIANIDKSTSGINYELWTTYKFDRVADQALGTGIGLSVQAEKRTSEYINIILPIESMAYTTDLSENDNELVSINFAPKVHFQHKRFMAKVGADLYYDNQLKSQIWPEVELAYGIVKNFVQIMVGTDQKYRMNTLGHLMNYNPWTQLDAFDLKTTLWKEYYGGIRGELNFLSYQFEGGYKESKNDLLIVNELQNGANSELITLYDDIKTAFVRGNIDFAISESMNVGGSLTQNVYTTNQEAKAWGMPSLEMNAYFNLHMFDNKLNLKSNLFLSDKIYTKRFVDGQAFQHSLNNLMELDAELAYWPIKSFGLFGYANNILDNKYQRWYGYPTVGINFGGGLQVKF